MKIPVMRGVIDRRILANYRLDPDVAAHVLPAPFRPKLVRGDAVAGVCLIRLKGVRPAWLPLGWGVRSENAAHRFAVEWNDGEQIKQGVFIPRRDTSSRLNALVGGRLFPGEHHHATFDVDETGDRLKVVMRSDDGQTAIDIDSRESRHFPDSSVFESLQEASAFFEEGSLGYSTTPKPDRFDGLELRCNTWHTEPLDVIKVHSSYFGDPEVFPQGSVTFDHALLMRNIPHEWHGRDELCCRPIASLH